MVIHGLMQIESRRFEWLVGSMYINSEGVRKDENILKLKYIKGVVWMVHRRE